MNIEKQTYLNTEELQSLLKTKGKAIACYGSSSRYGGIRFEVRVKGRVSLDLSFSSISADALLRLDGEELSETRYPFSHYEVTLSRGTHLFEAECSSHGGFVISAEGVGVAEGARYFDRVGGHSGEGETVVYTSNGDGTVTSHRHASVSGTSQLSVYAYDDALYYDKVGGVYTSTVRSASTGSARNAVLLSVGSAQSVAAQDIRSLAMCDGRTLESGADYLAAYTSGSGDLKFLRLTEGGTVTAADICTFSGKAARVVSAQRGSILMVQSPDGVWVGYYFHAAGTKSLSFPGYTFHYDAISLCRNRYVAPSATIDETDGSPVFYCKKESGELMRLNVDGESERIGYQEGYHAGLGGGFVQYAGEVRYEAE